MQGLSLSHHSRERRPVGAVKSLKLFKADSGVGSRVQKLRFKRGINPHANKGGEGVWQKTELIEAEGVFVPAISRMP
jgi:hypothetical protein